MKKIDILFMFIFSLEGALAFGCIGYIIAYALGGDLASTTLLMRGTLAGAGVGTAIGWFVFLSILRADNRNTNQETAKALHD